MTRCHNLLLVCLILSFPAFSGTIEVAQWIPWNFVAKEIISTPIDVHVNEPIYEMQIQELKPVAKDLEISISGGISDLEFNQSGMSATEVLKAQIHMSGLEIDQLITRVFNGNVIQVRVKASCTPIQIQIRELKAATHSAFVNDQVIWRPELMALSISIPSNAWSVSQFTCSGIGGVGEEIASQIKNALTNPAMFQDIIKEWLGVEIRSAFLSAWNSLLMSTGKDIKVTSMGKPGDLGLIVYGELPISSSRQVLLPEINHAELSSLNPQFIMSDIGFEAILEDKFFAMAPQKYNLQQVQGFADLMKSRFKQYMVWPDLRRFSSSTPFHVSADINQSRLSLKQETNNQWTAYLNSNGYIQTEIGGSAIDYIFYGMTVTTRMSVSMKDSKLTISNGASDLQLKWSYGLLYQMLFRPNNRIAVDILKGAMNGFFSNQKVTQELPVIRIDNREWKLQNWKQNKNLITMDWL